MKVSSISPLVPVTSHLLNRRLRGFRPALDTLETENPHVHDRNRTSIPRRSAYGLVNTLTVLISPHLWSSNLTSNTLPFEAKIVTV